MSRCLCGVGFQPSPALPGCWSLQLQGLMLFRVHVPIPAASPGSDSVRCDVLGDGDCTRGAIKETKLFKLLRRHLLRSPPEPGWSPAF